MAPSSLVIVAKFRCDLKDSSCAVCSFLVDGLLTDYASLNVSGKGFTTDKSLVNSNNFRRWLLWSTERRKQASSTKTTTGSDITGKRETANLGSSSLIGICRVIYLRSCLSLGYLTNALHDFSNLKAFLETLLQLVMLLKLFFVTLWLYNIAYLTPLNHELRSFSDSIGIGVRAFSLLHLVVSIYLLWWHLSLYYFSFAA